MNLSAAEVFRDHATEGVPSSGVHEPRKSEIRALLGQYEQVLGSFLSTGGLVYSSKAALDADLSSAANSMAWVVGDEVSGNNGIYRKVGASGAGSWSRVADLPYSFIVADDAGVGDPNAIEATSDLPISSSSLVLLNIYQNTTDSPVTVSFNGESPVTIKTSSGNDVAPGGLLGGMTVIGRVSGATFKLASDQASAAIQAAAEAAQGAAEAARDAAEGFASTAESIVGFDGSASTVSFDNAVAELPGSPVNVQGAIEVLAARPLGAPISQARLSLTAGVATPESDVAGATTIYLVPCGGVNVPVYDGEKFVPSSIGGGLSLILDNNAAHSGYHQSGRNFDLFVFDDGGTLRLATGPSWISGVSAGSDVARGTGSGSTELQIVNGVFVNANSISCRYGATSGDVVTVAAGFATYVGSFRAVANGQASDTAAKRLLFNAFNSVERPVTRFETTVSWTYSLTPWRQANNSVANQIEVLFGLAGISMSLDLVALVQGSDATGRTVKTAIGLDSTTAPAANCIFTSGLTVDGRFERMMASYHGYPGLGFHTLTWLEAANGSGTQTWYGFNNGVFRLGLAGRLLN